MLSSFWKPLSAFLTVRFYFNLPLGLTVFSQGDYSNPNFAQWYRLVLHVSILEVSLPFGIQEELKALLLFVVVISFQGKAAWHGESVPD